MGIRFLVHFSCCFSSIRSSKKSSNPAKELFNSNRIWCVSKILSVLRESLDGRLEPGLTLTKTSLEAGSGKKNVERVKTFLFKKFLKAVLVKTNKAKIVDLTADKNC